MDLETGEWNSVLLIVLGLQLVSKTTVHARRCHPSNRPKDKEACIPCSLSPQGISAEIKKKIKKKMKLSEAGGWRVGSIEKGKAYHDK